MKKRLLITIALLAMMVVTFGGNSAQAITWGTPDGNAHPYVGTLLFVQNGVGYYSCTGTLLSPTLMLTAGHCTEEAGNVNDVTYVRFDEHALEGRGDYATLQDWLDNEWILASSVIPHPNYNDFAEFPVTYDVGLVVLSEPVYMDTYGALPSEGFLVELAAQKGKSERFTAVGYGMQGVLNPFYSDEWSRYKGKVSLIELHSTNNGGLSATFTNNPGKGNGEGGTCYGDSGGPLFYENTNIVVAVVSWGITPCNGVDYQFRMDTATALNFVNANWQ